jgi:hypothetical protein
MKARGVAFAVESLANIGHQEENTFRRLEKVVLSKLDEFIPHYLVKVLASYYKSGFGSGEFYEKIAERILVTVQEGSIKYTDCL